MTHELKTEFQYLLDMKLGNKRFEVRKDDRNFKIGDILIIKEYDPVYGTYGDMQARRQINYILPGGQFGIEAGYVVLGLVNVLP